MSLVNNMLRDLDQRRKETSGSGGAVRLMPASEYVSENSKKSLPIIALVLAIVAIALVYVWLQSNQSGVDQELGIQVGSAPIATASDSEQIVRELEQSIAAAEAEDSSFVTATAVDAAPEQIDSQGSDSQIDPQISSSNTVRTGSAPFARETIASELSDSSTRTEDAVAPRIFERDAPREESQGPSVKEEPRFSTAQLDTIAVQDALRLISENNPAAAYSRLEEYIVENRNAHQSRETYAKLLMSRGMVADATALIDGGLEIAPNHSGFKKVKARLLMSEGNISDAVNILISRAPDVAEDIEYHDLLASAQLSSRDFAGAIISYRGLVEFDQTQGKWWYGYAASNDQLGNSSAARQSYLRAMQYSNLSANLRQRSQERVVALNP